MPVTDCADADPAETGFFVDVRSHGIRDGVGVSDDLQVNGFETNKKYLTSKGIGSTSLTWVVDAGTMNGTIDTVFQISRE